MRTHRIYGNSITFLGGNNLPKLVISAIEVSREKMRRITTVRLWFASFWERIADSQISAIDTTIKITTTSILRRKFTIVYYDASVDAQEC